jgi:hypothetical protein
MFRNILHSWSAAFAGTILAVYWFAYVVIVAADRLA